MDENKKTILILDDTKPIRILLLKRFEKHYNCLLAERSTEALELVNRYGKSISLIISDYELPDFNGFEFLKRAKNESAHIPVIMLSSRLNKFRIKDLFKLGVKKFLAKPVNINRLEKYVKSFLSDDKDEE